MDEEQQDSSYKAFITSWWEEITSLSTQFRASILVNTDGEEDVNSYDAPAGRNYIANMGRFWLELLPEVEGRTELKGLKEDFLGFRQYSADGNLFIKCPICKQVRKECVCEQKTDSAFDFNKLFLMEEILRKIMDKLEITGLGARKK